MKHYLLQFVGRPLFFVAAISVFLSSCASSTMLNSSPPGATVYVDGVMVGKTPYSHTDSKIVGSTTSLRFEKDGYEPLNAQLIRNEEVDVGAVIGGLFFLWPLFLWSMKYSPSHSYDMESIVGTSPSFNTMDAAGPDKTMKENLELLERLNALYQSGGITKSEYEEQKAQILKKL